MNYLRCSGEIASTIEGLPVCSTGWQSVPEDVLLSATPIKQLFDLLNAAFTNPPPSDIQTAFMAGFALPMICYLTAWAFGSVINFIK